MSKFFFARCPFLGGISLPRRIALQRARAREPNNAGGAPKAARVPREPSCGPLSVDGRAGPPPRRVRLDGGSEQQPDYSWSVPGLLQRRVDARRLHVPWQRPPHPRGRRLADHGITPRLDASAASNGYDIIARVNEPPHGSRANCVFVHLVHGAEVHAVNNRRQEKITAVARP